MPNMSLLSVRTGCEDFEYPPLHTEATSPKILGKRTPKTSHARIPDAESRSSGGSVKSSPSVVNSAELRETVGRVLFSDWDVALDMSLPAELVSGDFVIEGNTRRLSAPPALMVRAGDGEIFLEGSPLEICKDLLQPTILNQSSYIVTPLPRLDDSGAARVGKENMALGGGQASAGELMLDKEVVVVERQSPAEEPDSDAEAKNTPGPIRLMAPHGLSVLDVSQQVPSDVFLPSDGANGVKGPAAERREVQSSLWKNVQQSSPPSSTRGWKEQAGSNGQHLALSPAADEDDEDGIPMTLMYLTRGKGVGKARKIAIGQLHSPRSPTVEEQQHAGQPCVGSPREGGPRVGSPREGGLRVGSPRDGSSSSISSSRPMARSFSSPLSQDFHVSSPRRPHSPSSSSAGKPVGRSASLHKLSSSSSDALPLADWGELLDSSPVPHVRSPGREDTAPTWRQLYSESARHRNGFKDPAPAWSPSSSPSWPSQGQGQGLSQSQSQSQSLSLSLAAERRSRSLSPSTSRKDAPVTAILSAQTSRSPSPSQSSLSSSSPSSDLTGSGGECSNSTANSDASLPHPDDSASAVPAAATTEVAEGLTTARAAKHGKSSGSGSSKGARPDSFPLPKKGWKAGKPLSPGAGAATGSGSGSGSGRPLAASSPSDGAGGAHRKSPPAAVAAAAAAIPRDHQVLRHLQEPHQGGRAGGSPKQPKPKPHSQPSHGWGGGQQISEAEARRSTDGIRTRASTGSVSGGVGGYGSGSGNGSGSGRRDSSSLAVQQSVEALCSSVREAKLKHAGHPHSPRGAAAGEGASTAAGVGGKGRAFVAAAANSYMSGGVMRASHLAAAPQGGIVVAAQGGPQPAGVPLGYPVQQDGSGMQWLTVFDPVYGYVNVPVTGGPYFPGPLGSLPAPAPAPALGAGAPHNVMAFAGGAAAAARHSPPTSPTPVVVAPIGEAPGLRKKIAPRFSSSSGLPGRAKN